MWIWNRKGDSWKIRATGAAQGTRENAEAARRAQKQRGIRGTHLRVARKLLFQEYAGKIHSREHSPQSLGEEGRRSGTWPAARIHTDPSSRPHCPRCMHQEDMAELGVAPISHYCGLQQDMNGSRQTFRVLKSASSCRTRYLFTVHLTKTNGIFFTCNNYFNILIVSNIERASVIHAQER